MKVTILMCVLGLFLSCNRQESSRYVQVKEPVFESVKGEGGSLSRSLLFVCQGDSFIYMTTEMELHQMYESYYHVKDKDLSYEKFRAHLLTDNGNFHHWEEDDGHNFYETRFVRDDTVFKDYQNYGLKKFVEKYCKFNEDGEIVFMERYPLQKELTIAYCMWQNGLRYVRDDYVGEDFFY